MRILKIMHYGAYSHLVFHRDVYMPPGAVAVQNYLFSPYGGAKLVVLHRRARGEKKIVLHRSYGVDFGLNLVLHRWQWQCSNSNFSLVSLSYFVSFSIATVFRRRFVRNFNIFYDR